MILVFQTFAGKYQPEKLDKKPHEAPIGMLISPLILGVACHHFWAFSQICYQTVLIAPAMAAILPSLLHGGEEFDVHISFWHGFTIELFMTLGVIVIGIYSYIKLYPKWKKIYRVYSQKSFLLIAFMIIY